MHFFRVQWPARPQFAIRYSLFAIHFGMPFAKESVDGPALSRYTERVGCDPVGRVETAVCGATRLGFASIRCGRPPHRATQCRAHRIKEKTPMSTYRFSRTRLLWAATAVFAAGTVDGTALRPARPSVPPENAGGAT
jgi:hypothetical protein